MHMMKENLGEFLELEDERRGKGRLGFQTWVRIFGMLQRATKFCFFEAQDTRDLPKNWQVPDVLFLLILHPAQSASE
jgi:hypothetical protein